MLFGRHLGFRGNFEKALGERDARALELFNSMEEIKREARKFMKIGAVWQFFEAERQGNSIALFAAGGGSPVHTFHFQRQRVGDKLCLSDYILPAQRRPARSSGAVRGHGRRGHPRKIRGSKSRGRISLLPRPAGAGARNRRSLRRMAAPPHSRGLGFPRSAQSDHGRTVHLALSRQSATASAIPLARIWKIRPASGCCSVPRTSACISPKA